MAAAATPDQVAEQLRQHDRLRRSTDIPTFYGIPSRDTITATQLVKRVERASRVAGWNAATMIDQFFLSLRDEAINWHNALERRPGFDIDNWDAVKAEFLAAYATKYTALSICTTIQTLCQKTDEPVQMFFNRVDMVFDNAKFVRPVNVMEFQGADAELHTDGVPAVPAVAADPAAVPPVVGHAAVPAVPALDIPRPRANQLVALGAGQMERYLMMVVFVGGLKSEIRDEMLKRNINTAEEALDEARKIELILKDEREKKTRGTAVTSIEEDEDEIMLIEEEDVAHVEAINAIRRRQGKRPFRFKVRRSENRTCHYCKKPGHLIKDCRTRLRNENRTHAVQSENQNPYQTKPLN
jgi:hypothetical protein